MTILKPPAVPSPSTVPLQREIPLDGCFNFRDLGGLPTRDGGRTVSGAVFRSDTLDDIGPYPGARHQQAWRARIVPSSARSASMTCG